MMNALIHTRKGMTMSDPDLRITATMGALIRGPFRRAIMDLDLDYQEDKGWLDSHFVIRGPTSKIEQLVEYGNYLASDK